MTSNQIVRTTHKLSRRASQHCLRLFFRDCVGCLVLVTCSARADFVGVSTTVKDDPDTANLCIAGNGDFVPGPLHVCNVYAEFDSATDRLLAVTNADISSDDGAYFQHPFGADTPYDCFLQEAVFPDLLCDSYVTIGNECNDGGTDGTTTDSDFDPVEFNTNGHVVGGWYNTTPENGQGDAGVDLRVLLSQLDVSIGVFQVSGTINVLWRDTITGDEFEEIGLPLECIFECPPPPAECDDGDACTENDMCFFGVCTGTPIDCDDGNDCTNDSCDPATGMCIHIDNSNPCDDGNDCTENDMCISGKCVGVPVPCSPQSNIDPDHKFAWSENCGWTNWQHDAPKPGDGVLVTETFLVGFVWGENIGWINLGDGTLVRRTTCVRTASVPVRRWTAPTRGINATRPPAIRMARTATATSSRR